MNIYKVSWHTSVGVGSTYYAGVETVEAENDEQAAVKAQRIVWSRAFRDYPKSHIVVTEITCVSKG